MSEFLSLVYNECEKIYRKKRLAVILLILATLIPIFVYAQAVDYKAVMKRLGTNDWKVLLQQQIIDTQNRLNSSRMPNEYKKVLKVRMQQQQYYLEHNINPNEPGAPTFTRVFIEQSMGLFLPLLIMIIAIDIVSGERSDGTIKVLLTRPIRRWKILLSKYVTILLYSAVILFFVALLSYLISGIAFGYSGWGVPILTGFEIQNDNLITDHVYLLPLWRYIWMAISLAWFVVIVIGTICFMISVLIRNTPAGMGTMLAALITGGILTGFSTTWEGAKYIFSVNLSLTNYLSGQVPALSGLNLGFSLAVLTMWALVAIVISFIVFTRQDFLG